MKVSGKLAIGYWPLGDIKPLPRNAKGHDLEEIILSIQTYGFVDPIGVNEATGHDIDGNGRREALVEMKNRKLAVPRGIEVQGGNTKRGVWLVPVVRGIHVPAEKEEAFALELNRTNERGGVDETILAAILQDLAKREDGLAGSGYSKEDLDSLLLRLKEAAADGQELRDATPQVDRAKELRKKWKTKPGQLWTIGAHRLLIGDATDKETVARLLRKAKPGLMVTDPPYGVDYDASWRSDAADKGLLRYSPTRTGQVKNDDRKDWSEAYLLFPGNVAYVWHADRHASAVEAQLKKVGFEIRCQVIWAKSNFPISRGHYHWRHEPCWYAFRKGRSANWIGDHKQTTLWEINLDKNTDGGHSTQKPLECMLRPLRNHSGDVYDPFVGTGTSIVAAENLKRKCFAMDISPEYGAVSLERMAQAFPKIKIALSGSR